MEVDDGLDVKPHRAVRIRLRAEVKNYLVKALSTPRFLSAGQTNRMCEGSSRPGVVGPADRDTALAKPLRRRDLAGHRACQLAVACTSPRDGNGIVPYL